MTLNRGGGGVETGGRREEENESCIFVGGSHGWKTITAFC